MEATTNLGVPNEARLNAGAIPALRPALVRSQPPIDRQRASRGRSQRPIEPSGCMRWALRRTARLTVRLSVRLAALGLLDAVMASLPHLKGVLGL
eukprot:9310180-Pyramimonas_sp.AAC.1